MEIYERILNNLPKTKKELLSFRLVDSQFKTMIDHFASTTIPKEMTRLWIRLHPIPKFFPEKGKDLVYDIVWDFTNHHFLIPEYFRGTQCWVESLNLISISTHCDFNSVTHSIPIKTKIMNRLLNALPDGKSQHQFFLKRLCLVSDIKRLNDLAMESKKFISSYLLISS